MIETGKETGHDLAIAYCNRGLALTEKRQLDEAFADLEKAIAADGSYACPYSNRGRIKRFKGDLEGAIADYDAAIKRDPKFSIAYNNRGDAWMAAGSLGKAIGDFSQAIKLDPKNALALGNRGYAYFQKHDLDRAIADFNKQIALTPDNIIAHLNRGNAYREKGDAGQATADYAEVIRITSPRTARGWRNHGLMHLMAEEWKEGIADYDQAIRFDPKDTFSWNNRAIASGRPATAPAPLPTSSRRSRSVPTWRRSRSRLRNSALHHNLVRLSAGFKDGKCLFYHHPQNSEGTYIFCTG